MDALLVFAYFLVKLLARLGAESGAAEWGAAILSCVCVVSVMMAPFHPKDVFKTSMAGISWMVIVMAAIGCVWECKEAQAAADSRVVSEPPREIHLPASLRLPANPSGDLPSVRAFPISIPKGSKLVAVVVRGTSPTTGSRDKPSLP